MKRQDKFPETQTFHYYNANPRNRITSDCVFRAIARATEIPYNDVVKGLAELHCLTGYECTDKRTIDSFLKAHGWTKNKQPRKADNTKYTGKEFCLQLQAWNKDFPQSENGRYVAMIGGNHVIAIVNGKVNDTWNSTGGCIGNYWTK